MGVSHFEFDEGYSNPSIAALISRGGVAGLKAERDTVVSARREAERVAADFRRKAEQADEEVARQAAFEKQFADGVRNLIRDIRSGKEAARLKFRAGDQTLTDWEQSCWGFDLGEYERIAL